jgi:AbrB family looped-hinge helix DNA binding protein
MYIHMTIRTVTQTEKGESLLRIPAFIRDHFGLSHGDSVDVGLEGDKIVVTPLKEGEQ